MTVLRKPTPGEINKVLLLTVCSRLFWGEGGGGQQPRRNHYGFHSMEPHGTLLSRIPYPIPPISVSTPRPPNLVLDLRGLKGPREALRGLREPLRGLRQPFRRVLAASEVSDKLSELSDRLSEAPEWHCQITVFLRRVISSEKYANASKRDMDLESTTN